MNVKLGNNSRHRFKLVLPMRATWKVSKAPLEEVTVTKPKYNLSRNKVTAPKELKNNSALNLKKTDKGTATIIFSTTKIIEEAKVQLDSRVVEHQQVCLRFLDNTDDRPQNTCVSSDNLDCFS